METNRKAAGLTFDQNSPYFSFDDRQNEFYVKNKIHYLLEKFNIRGYLYMNEISEIFGIPWDPEVTNVCFNRRKMPEPRITYVRDAIGFAYHIRIDWEESLCSQGA